MTDKFSQLISKELNIPLNQVAGTVDLLNEATPFPL